MDGMACSRDTTCSANHFTGTNSTGNRWAHTVRGILHSLLEKRTNNSQIAENNALSNEISLAL
jgi:hypothetical protein